MTWKNVRLILAREIRDQLRDRRTMFMIFVLPILLYPLMGLSVSQIWQFMRERPTRILVAGAETIEGVPPLVENDRFRADLFADARSARLLKVTFADGEPPAQPPDVVRKRLREAILSGDYDAAVYFPPDFAERLKQFRERIAEHVRGDGGGVEREQGPVVTSTSEVPSPEIIYNTASERSFIAFARLSDLMRRWTEQIGESNLKESGVPVVAARPFAVTSADVADASGLRGAATWAKLLPMLLVLWAMTGAFYPAVDLCAGEKERGTLETLLSSPAQRSEIVLGKLLTIMLFSMATAVLNIASIAVTGLTLLGQMPTLGPPPWFAFLWLPLALVPIAALYSALCLALAALARSTKEGQYYLMPLMVVSMPLVVVPMSPGVELTLGNSLVPVMGLVLLLRELISGQGWSVVPYVAPVAVVTLLCCVAAIRWAVAQFNRESVLFRESERFDLGLWLRRVLEEKRPTPAPAEAVICGLTILLIQYFLSLAIKAPSDSATLLRQMLAVQLAVIVVPTLLMTVFFTSSPAKTLLLRRPPLSGLLAALVLAVVFQPTAHWLQSLVLRVFPMNEAIAETLKHYQEMLAQTPLWTLLIVVALAPAVFEELAFRGFVLSGLRRTGYPIWAALGSAFFFACAHPVLQQSINAFVLGVVLALIAMRTGSILPGMLFHFTNNALTSSMTKLSPQVLERWPALHAVISLSSEGAPQFPTWALVASAVLSVGILLWLFLLPYERTAEEESVAALRRAADEAA